MEVLWNSTIANGVMERPNSLYLCKYIVFKTNIGEGVIPLYLVGTHENTWCF